MTAEFVVCGYDPLFVCPLEADTGDVKEHARKWKQQPRESGFGTKPQRPFLWSPFFFRFLFLLHSIDECHVKNEQATEPWETKSTTVGRFILVVVGCGLHNC